MLLVWAYANCKESTWLRLTCVKGCPYCLFVICLKFAAVRLTSLYKKQLSVLVWFNLHGGQFDSVTVTSIFLFNGWLTHHNRIHVCCFFVVEEASQALNLQASLVQPCLTGLSIMCVWLLVNHIFWSVWLTWNKVWQRILYIVLPQFAKYAMAMPRLWPTWNNMFGSKALYLQVSLCSITLHRLVKHICLVAVISFVSPFCHNLMLSDVTMMCVKHVKKQIDACDVSFLMRSGSEPANLSSDKPIQQLSAIVWVHLHDGEFDRVTVTSHSLVQDVAAASCWVWTSDINISIVAVFCCRRSHQAL